MHDPLAERRRKSYEYAVSLSELPDAELTPFEEYLRQCQQIAEEYLHATGYPEGGGHYVMIDLFKRFTRISKSALPKCVSIEDGLHKTIAVFAHCRRHGYRTLDLPGIQPRTKRVGDWSQVQRLARMPLGVDHRSETVRETAKAFDLATKVCAGMIETRQELIELCGEEYHGVRIRPWNVDSQLKDIDKNLSEPLRIVYSKSKWHALRRHKRAEAPPSSDTLVQRPEEGFRSLADLRARADADRAQRAARAVDAISMPNMERAARYEQARKERAEALRLQRQAEREKRRREHEKTQEWKEKRIAELIRKGYGNAAIREKAGVSTAYHLPPEVEDFTRPKGHGGHYWSERMEYIARAMRRAMRKRVPVEVYLQEYGLTPRVFTYALRFNAFYQVALSKCVKIPPSWKAKGEPLYDTSADTNEHAREAAAIAAE